MIPYIDLDLILLYIYYIYIYDPIVLLFDVEVAVLFNYTILLQQKATVKNLEDYRQRDNKSVSSGSDGNVSGCGRLWCAIEAHHRRPQHCSARVITIDASAVGMNLLNLFAKSQSFST